MKILVTGSAGHLGEALMHTLRESAHTAVGLDLKPNLQAGLDYRSELARRVGSKGYHVG